MPTAAAAIMVPHFSPPTQAALISLGGGRAEGGREEGTNHEAAARGYYWEAESRGRLPPLRRRPTLNFGMEEEEEASKRGRGNRIRRWLQLYEYDPSTQLEWRTE